MLILSPVVTITQYWLKYNPSDATPQYFKNSFNPIGTVGACSFKNEQWEAQSACPYNGVSVQIQPRHALDYILRQMCRVHWDACMYQYNSMVMQIIRTVYNYKLPSFDTYSEDRTISKCHQSPTNYHILWVKIVSMQWPYVPRTMIALAAQECEEVIVLLVVYAPLNWHSVLHTDSGWG